MVAVAGRPSPWISFANRLAGMIQCQDADIILIDQIQTFSSVFSSERAASSRIKR